MVLRMPSFSAASTTLWVPSALVRATSLSGTSMMRAMAAKCTTASILGARSEGENSRSSSVLVCASDTCRSP